MWTKPNSFKAFEKKCSRHKSFSCPLMNSSNFNLAQLEHICIILKPLKKKTEVNMTHLKKYSLSKTENLFKYHVLHFKGSLRKNQALSLLLICSL